MKLSLDDLHSIRIFSNLSDRTLQEIDKKVHRRIYSSGVVILTEREPCKNVYFIQKGEVRIYRTSFEGKEQTLTRMGKGASFNTVPSLHVSGINQANVSTLTNSALLLLSNDDYMYLLQNFPDFCYAVLLDFADRLVYLTNLVENLSLHSVRGRLAHFLLEQADQDKVTRRWTQDEIAEHLGSVRDVIGRELRAFADEGIIRRERNQVILLNRKILEIEADY